jgi:hypothetical protein
MSTSITAPPELQALIAAKEAAEATNDPEAILGAFVDDPVFEFRPIGLRISGREAVKEFYVQMLNHFVSRVEGFRALNTFWNDTGMAMEEEITFRDHDGVVRVVNFIVMTGVADGGLWGERLYGDESFFRHLLGDLFDRAESIA